MTSPRFNPLCIAGGILLLCVCAVPNSLFGNTFVQFDYNLSLASDHSRKTVFIELFDDRPLTRDNFLQYVNGGHYDDMFMHRSVPGFVLQGGGFYPQVIQDLTLPTNNNFAIERVEVDLDGNPATDNPTVNNEFSNSPFRSNLRSTLAMAKMGGDPNSATSEFFFNLGNNAGNLDNQNGGFTVFAEVINGMNLIDAFSTSGIDLNVDDVTYVRNTAGQIIEVIQTPDGLRDLGAFGEVPTPGGNLVIVEKAEVIDFFKNGSPTNVGNSANYHISSNSFYETGATFTGSATLEIDAGVRFGMQDQADIDLSVLSRGTLHPGLSLGDVELQSFQQTATGTLEIDLRGTTAGTEHDKVSLVGNGVLGGSLEINFYGGYTPLHGEEFTIIETSSGQLSGEFANIELPELLPGLVWNISQTSLEFTLSTIHADYNFDGVVDAADYTVWRDSLNSTTDPSADGNGDGVVNQADYDIWKANFGNTAGGPPASASAQGAAVPEPTALLLLGGCMAAMFAMRWRLG